LRIASSLTMLAVVGVTSRRPLKKTAMSAP